MNSALEIGRGHPPDEKMLLAGLRAGIPEACTTFFNAYANKIYRLACGLLCEENAAEDVVQETFLKALSHLDEFENRSSLSTWLYRIAYNTSVSRLRHRQRRDAVVITTHLTDIDNENLPQPAIYMKWSVSAEELLLDTEVCTELNKSICELPLLLRTVFILRDVEGLTAAESAETLAVSEMTIRRRLNRARLLLRESLAVYFHEQNGSKAYHTSI